MSPSTRPPPRRRTSRSASTIGVQAEGPGTASTRLRAVRLLVGRQHRRGDARGLRSGHGAAALQQGRQARPDSGGGGGGYDGGGAARVDQLRAAARAPRYAPEKGQADEDASETQSFLSFLQGFLLAFGGIALFVGAFVIANSLSITIAQRTREFATLRTIGASRRQIMRAVLDRGARHRAGRLGRRHRARPCPREGPLLALRAGRVHASQQRPAPADANGDRRDDRRRPRNRHREPAPRPPRDARASDRRRPRGRGAAARTLRIATGPSARRCSASPASRSSPTGCSAAASRRRRSFSPWASAPC